MDLWRIEEASVSHLVCILCLPEVFGRTFVKQTSIHHVILLIKIQGVLLLKMDLWRIEEASIGHLVCISCLFEVIGRTFVKKTSLHHVILLVKIQGVLLLKMDLLRIEEASISHLVCILCLPEVFGRTFVKQTSLHHVILLIKIQGVLLLKMDLWRIEEAYFEERFLGKLPSIMSFSLSRFKGSSCSGWISGGPLELPCSIKYGGPLPWYLMSFRLSDWLVAPLRLSSIDTLDTIKA